MAEVFGAIQRALGDGLAWLYSVTHLYVLAIILLTVAVRALLIPLTVKQIRSMTAMQKMAPEQKKIQQKYKQLQQKAKDRVEVQQLRLQMNQELQGLYKAAGVNPLGGCLPLLAQMPVFIALYSVFRATIVVSVAAAATVGGTANPAPESLPNGRKADPVICRPVEASFPAPTGETPTKVECKDKTKSYGVYAISNVVDAKKTELKINSAPWINFCQPTGKPNFLCYSPTGTGHIPQDSKLFTDVTQDKATVLGMHAGCSASQVKMAPDVRTCTTKHAGGGGTSAVPYYILVGLIVVTSYYQSKQMAQKAPAGAQQQQQQMMTRIMPVMFGFISLQIPAGANVYFLTTNLWTIGQQAYLLKRQESAGDVPAPPARAGRASLLSRFLPRAADQQGEAPKQVTPPPPQRKSKKKKGKR